MNIKELQPPGGWIVPARPRIAPPDPTERGLVFRAVSSAARFFGRKEVPDIFSVFHINPRLFWAWLFFASRLMPYGRLAAQEREKVILRTAWNCRSRYEWGQHVDIALSVGVPDEDIVKVTEGPQAFTDPRSRALLQACDETCRDHCISAPTWELLAAQHDDKILIEIVILIGHYQMVAGFLNSTGIALEAPVETKLQEFLQRIGPMA